MAAVTAPWAALDIDPDRAPEELARRFPQAVVWLGEFTGSWWAMVRNRAGEDRLLEAAVPAELERVLREFFRCDASRPVRPMPAGPDGAWTGAGVRRGHSRPVQRSAPPPRGGRTGTAVRTAPPTDRASHAAASPPHVVASARWADRRDGTDGTAHRQGAPSSRPVASPSRPVVSAGPRLGRGRVRHGWVRRLLGALVA